MAASFRRVAIIGTGLIGGSFALALRKYFPDTVVVGWDKPRIMSMVVVLPAPFGPSSATISPGLIVTSTPRTARTGPKLLCIARKSTAAGPLVVGR
jgi:hypothetical protein